MDTKIFKTIFRQMIKLHGSELMKVENEEQMEKLKDNFEKLIPAYFITAGLMVALTTVTKLRLM